MILRVAVTFLGLISKLTTLFLQTNYNYTGIVVHPDNNGAILDSKGF
jgi:hypothetical protein